MTTNELEQVVAAQLNRLAELVGGTAWGAEKGKPRIYMASARDRKVFFEFPDFPTGDADALLGGASLKVSIDDCGQHPNWYVGQRAKVVTSMHRRGLALAAAHAGDWQLAEEIMDCDADFDAGLVDEVSSHLINGRTAEARAAMGL